jgi:hypothetical protein
MAQQKTRRMFTITVIGCQNCPFKEVCREYNTLPLKDQFLLNSQGGIHSDCSFSAGVLTDESATIADFYDAKTLKPVNLFDETKSIPVFNQNKEIVYYDYEAEEWIDEEGYTISVNKWSNLPPIQY